VGRGREGIVTRDSSHPSPGSREKHEKKSRGNPTEKTGWPGEVFIG